ncbi:MAG: VanZ family protein [Gammaproteobacteria bacterium]|nr:VanZ family protein [Gammaproteobacteria bacterium]
MRYLSLACALLWAGTLYYLSDQPGMAITPLFSHQDKAMHVVAYALLGLFCMGALQQSTAGYRPAQLWAVTALTGVYGLLDEYHQSFIPGRFSSLGDVIADLVGGFLGALLVYLLARRLARRNHADGR